MAEELQVVVGSEVEEIDDLKGSVLGHCLLETKLGEGGMGTVYRARHVSLAKQVAVKVLRSDLSPDSKALERFLKEARAAASLEHPNIVSVYDAGNEGGRRYIVMQYVEGETLGARLSREGALPVAEALRIFRAVARGVAYAHARGIVHRDIKPDNILLGRDGSVKVTDFGLARMLENDPSLSATGMIIGSPSFMPPEQACGERDIDERADVYALGALMYAMVVGTPPYWGESPIDILYKVVREPLVPPHKRNPRVPLALSQYICLLMRKDRSRRLRSVSDVLGILNRIYPAGASSRRRRSSRHWLPAVALVVGVFLLAFGVLLGPLPFLATKSSSAQANAERTEEANAPKVPSATGESQGPQAPPNRSEAPRPKGR